MSPSAPANPKIRVTAIVLLVLGAVCLFSAVTGHGATGTGERIIFGVFAAVMLPLGLLALRSKGPAVQTVRLDARGLVLAIAGSPQDVVPWEAVRAFGLRGVGAPQRAERLGFPAPGLVLTVDLVAGDVPPRLRALQVPHGDGTVRLVVGLTRSQATALRMQVDDFADRLRTIPPTA